MSTAALAVVVVVVLLLCRFERREKRSHCLLLFLSQLFEWHQGSWIYVHWTLLVGIIGRRKNRLLRKEAFSLWSVNAENYQCKSHREITQKKMWRTHSADKWWCINKNFALFPLTSTCLVQETAVQGVLHSSLKWRIKSGSPTSIYSPFHEIFKLF